MTTLYPPGPVTVLGDDLMLEHTDPLIMVTALDRSRSFTISGGLAPWPRAQDGIVLQRISMPTPDFKHLDSQGARQDGVTWNDTVFEAMDIDCIVAAYARTPAGLSKVVSDWVAVWNPRQLVRVEWLTFENGLWWCDARLNTGSWRDKLERSPRRHKRHILTHRARVDDSFWKSVDSTSLFRFQYNDDADSFDVDDPDDLGPGWDITDLVPGPGFIHADGGQAVWSESGTTEHTVAAKRVGYTSATDNQVVEVEFGSFPFPENGAYNDIWLRMGESGGVWDGNGVRLRFGWFLIRLSRFNNFVETVMKEQIAFLPPLIGEKFTGVAGFDDDPRTFKLLRNGLPVFQHKEVGTGSLLGSDYRGAGQGWHAGAGIVSQAAPGSIRRWSAGDNATITQSGFLPLANVGDQDGWPQYVFYGPGLLELGNGPGTTETIKFGPLLDGQIALITTHPRVRNVVDLTPGAGEQQLDEVQELIDTLIKLVTFNQVPPLLQWFESVFGILPPQGPLYSLLDGRFSRPVPGVPQPSDAVTSKITVKITDGNANSRVVASLTPQRRWPE